MQNRKKKELIFIILFTSITTFILITNSNINRPDAGLYHLPYISILQENKLILGLTNIHYRFGHISIFQYISAIFNNYFFKEEFLNIPLASLFSFFLLFLFKELNSSFKKKNNMEIIPIFFIIIFSLYSFNRYSGYGNDAPASIFFFILIIVTLKIDDIKNINSSEFFNILIISIFLFTIKPSMIIVLVLPLLLFFYNKNKLKILKNKNSLICTILLATWIIKNILISGCLVFPLKITCFEKLKFYDEEIINIASNEAEAWSKGYPDSIKKMNFKQYNSNFNWVKTWFNNHFLKIQEKLLPLLLFIFLFLSKNIIKSLINKSFNFKKKFENKKILLIIVMSLYCSIFWFLKFPVYRLGLSFISTLVIFLSIFIFVDKNKSLYNNKVYLSIIGIGLSLFYAKNFNRIIDNYDVIYNNSPWPKIYSMDEKDKNIKKKFQKMFDDKGNFIYYYSGGQECMYSKSPCSNYNLKNIVRDSVNGYTIFYSTKN